MTNTTKERRRGVTAQAGNGDGDSDSDETYWRTNFRSRPYVDSDTGYEVYQSAYKYGASARRRHPGKSWRDVEAELEAGWATARDESDLDWSVAKNACRDAWDHVDRFMRE
jgi:hypothetical protein